MTLHRRSFLQMTASMAGLALLPRSLRAACSLGEAPGDFKARYDTLAVTLDDGTALKLPLAIRYLTSTGRGISAEAAEAAAWLKLRALGSDAARYRLQAGKASPEDFAALLVAIDSARKGCVTEFVDLDSGATSSPLPEFAAYASKDLDDPNIRGEMLQRFAAARFGLDCNGFAGQWAAAAGLERRTCATVKKGYCYDTPLLSETHPPDIARGAMASARTSVSDIEQGDLLVWLHARHVAVVDEVAVDGAPERVRTCESAAEQGYSGLCKRGFTLVPHDQVTSETLNEQELSVEARDRGALFLAGPEGSFNPALTAWVAVIPVCAVTGLKQ